MVALYYNDSMRKPYAKLMYDMGMIPTRTHHILGMLESKGFQGYCLLKAKQGYWYFWGEDAPVWFSTKYFGHQTIQLHLAGAVGRVYGTETKEKRCLR